MNRLINLCEKHNNTILCHRKCVICEQAEENTQLQDQLDALMTVAQILANTFPEDDMSEMDASVFVDRAGETMTVVDKAKDALAKVKEIK